MSYKDESLVVEEAELIERIELAGVSKDDLD
jgi:hypothetical protein